MNDAFRVLSFLRGQATLGNAPRFKQLRDVLKIDSGQLERTITGLLNRGEIVRYDGGYQIPREPLAVEKTPEPALDAIHEDDHTIANDAPDGPSFMLDAPEREDVVDIEREISTRTEPTPMTPKIETKTCTGKCGKTLPIDDFYPHHGKCKTCYNEHHNATKLARRDAAGIPRPTGKKKPETPAPPPPAVTKVTAPEYFNFSISLTRDAAGKRISLTLAPGIEVAVEPKVVRDLLDVMEVA